MIEPLAYAALLLGSLLALIATIGLHRFDDVFARMHAATKPATLGLALIAGGAALLLRDAPSVAKLALVVALQFTTAPVGSHLVGRATYAAGTELSPQTSLDELGEDTRGL